jgi:hypothetical protein
MEGHLLIEDTAIPRLFVLVAADSAGLSQPRCLALAMRGSIATSWKSPRFSLALAS